MLGALSLAFIDSVNMLLIGVIVAVGIVVPRGRNQYAKTTSLLIVGDWLGVAGLALIMLVIFDGLGSVVQRFVEGPIFGIVLVAVGVATGLLALKGGNNSQLVERIMQRLRTPSPATILTGVVLGLVQSATSAPFYGGLALLSAAEIDSVTRYASLLLYATVALSLPVVCAFVVAIVRARPASAPGRAFAWARSNPRPVTLGATWAVAVMLIALGIIHLF